jgi:hypothetical protein
MKKCKVMLKNLLNDLKGIGIQLGKLLLAYAAFSLILWAVYKYTKLSEITGIEMQIWHWFGILIIFLIFKATHLAGSIQPKNKQNGPEHKPYRKRS